MTRGWSWDFEDERERAARAASRPKLPAAPPPSPPPTPPPGRPPSYRRRQGAALLTLGGAVLIVALALSGSSGRHRAPSVPAPSRVRRTPAQPAPPPENADQGAVSAVLAYTPFVATGSSRARDVALTFDDGPGPYTPQVLSVLERLHVHATFFVIGKMLQYFSASAVREIHDGDVIGDHTETHPMMASLSAHEQREELLEQIIRVEALGGSRPDLFRPPYGSFNATTLHELHAMHLLMVLWTVDTGDYLQPGVPAIVQRALAGARPGAIILLHDAGGTRTQTVAALPAIIRGLRSRGFHLVTVPRLMLNDPPPAGEPVPPNLSGD